MAEEEQESRSCVTNNKTTDGRPVRPHMNYRMPCSGMSGSGLAEDRVMCCYYDPSYVWPLSTDAR